MLRSVRVDQVLTGRQRRLQRTHDEVEELLDEDERDRKPTKIDIAA